MVSQQPYKYASLDLGAYLVRVFGAKGSLCHLVLLMLLRLRFVSGDLLIELLMAGCRLGLTTVLACLALHGYASLA